MAGNEVAIIVPVFREAGNIRKLVTGLHASLPDIDWEVVFVDDDSMTAPSRKSRTWPVAMCV